MDDHTHLQERLYEVLEPFYLFGDLWVGVGLTYTDAHITAYCGPHLLIDRTIQRHAKTIDQIVEEMARLDGQRLVRQAEDWIHGSRAQASVSVEQVSLMKLHTHLVAG